MRKVAFSRAVVLETRIGRYRYVLTAKDAGRVLLREWPVPPGKQHEAACAAALAVIRGKKPPSHARRALVRAAKEAGILSEEGLAEFEAAYPDLLPMKAGSAQLRKPGNPSPG